MLHFYKEVLSITSACSILVTYNDFTIGRLHTSRNVLRLQLCHKTTFLFFACLLFFFFFWFLPCSQKQINKQKLFLKKNSSLENYDRGEGDFSSFKVFEKL